MGAAVGDAGNGVGFANHLCLGHGSGAHAPNEYMVIEPAAGTGIAGLADVEKAYVDLLYALANS